MTEISCQFGAWQVKCLPEDGGRLSALRYGGVDLLTAAPVNFRPPSGPCGPFEHRLVYGYDDCFPSVDSCQFPGPFAEVPDHGELCYLAWEVEPKEDQLVCRARSRRYEATFERLLHFHGRVLSWNFAVDNHGRQNLPFLHAMHGLMPVEKVRAVHLPSFGRAIDEGSGEAFPTSTPAEFQSFLLSRQRGFASTILVRELAEGWVRLTLDRDMSLTIRFPMELMPTLAIWWNLWAWPDEDGLRRAECAFEPLPGTCSSLAKSSADGVCMWAEPGRRRQWQIEWEMGPAP